MPISYYDNHYTISTSLFVTYILLCAFYILWCIKQSSSQCLSQLMTIFRLSYAFFRRSYTNSSLGLTEWAPWNAQQPTSIGSHKTYQSWLLHCYINFWYLLNFFSWTSICSCQDTLNSHLITCFVAPKKNRST